MYVGAPRSPQLLNLRSYINAPTPPSESIIGLRAPDLPASSGGAYYLKRRSFFTYEAQRLSRATALPKVLPEAKYKYILASPASLSANRN